MKRAFLAMSCLCLCSPFAIAQASKPMTDQQFVDFAAQTDMVEAHLGNLAQSKATSQSLKDYGQMLEADHTNDFQQLQSVARQAGFNVPTAIDAEHNKSMIAPFYALKGATFDHKFVQDMVSGHTQAIAIYKKEADNAQNPELKSYAQTALPVLQKHLDDAKAIEQGKPPAAR
ncbi:MAG TPA: DUF4142 domain-containing protein [Terracidiphilus sp.]|nr:DUF4142 domain-containing protein [Terracidiphilus sp.]